MATSTGTVARSTAKAHAVAMAQEVGGMKDTPQNRQGIDCLYQAIFGIGIILAVFLVLAAIVGGG